MEDCYLQNKCTCAISEMWRVCCSRMTLCPTILPSQCLRFGPKCHASKTFRCFSIIYKVCRIWLFSRRVMSQLLCPSCCVPACSMMLYGESHHLGIYYTWVCHCIFISMQYFFILIVLCVKRADGCQIEAKVTSVRTNSWIKSIQFAEK